MKKLLKKIVLSLVCAMIVFTGIVLFQGYDCYRDVIEVAPLQEVVAKEQRSIEHYVSYDELSKPFVNAVVAVEDKRFFYRKGFDFLAFSRALLHNIYYRKIVEGGSTISQQIAKNLYFQGKPRSLKEKVAEVYIMKDLENSYSKSELLALYVNMNYYGDGNWGIYQASKNYYNLTPKDLNLAKSAMLAGIPNAPAIYQLSTGFDSAKRRQKIVLQSMLNNDYIDKQELHDAIAEDVSPIHPEVSQTKEVLK